MVKQTNLALVLLTMCANASAICEAGFDKYVANKVRIATMLNQSTSNVSSPQYLAIEADQFRYRICISGVSFLVMRMVEVRDGVLVSQFLNVTDKESDPSIRSLRAWTAYSQSPVEGISQIVSFFEPFEVARRTVFEMNEILLKDFGHDRNSLPDSLRAHGSFSGLYADILTKHYLKDTRVTAIFDRLVSQADLGAEYRDEYASYVRKNIPGYRDYARLRAFVESGPKR
jgi:hypothetical protein